LDLHQSRDRDIYIKSDKNDENSIASQVAKYHNDLWNSNEVEYTPIKDLMVKNCDEVFFQSYCTGKQNELYAEIKFSKNVSQDTLSRHKLAYPEWFNTNYNWIDNNGHKDVKMTFIHDEIGKNVGSAGTAQGIYNLMLSANETILGQNSIYGSNTKNA